MSWHNGFCQLIFPFDILFVRQISMNHIPCIIASWQKVFKIKNCSENSIYFSSSEQMQIFFNWNLIFKNWNFCSRWNLNKSISKIFRNNLHYRYKMKFETVLQCFKRYEKMKLGRNISIWFNKDLSSLKRRTSTVWPCTVTP